MNTVAIVLESVLVAIVLADMVNTLVTTSTSNSRWWPTRLLYVFSWRLISGLGRHIEHAHRRERLYAVFAPLSVLAMLVAWVTQQVVGFGLIWWGLRSGIDGDNGLLDSLYFSGVVYFTVGFGEVVPADQIPRFGALVEAFCGVLTVALVIGYLPALYSAYSEREQKLLTLDDGSEQRVTPTNLVFARVPDSDVRRFDAFFQDWEAWMAQVLETHTTFPMLRLFRSQRPGQNWIPALGLVADAAMHIELTKDGRDGPSYWALRQAAVLVQSLTEGVDLSDYRNRLDRDYASNDTAAPLYEAMVNHGFEMLPFEQVEARALALRRTYDAQLEYLIDTFDTPRGFWGHTIGHPLQVADALDVEARNSYFESSDPEPT